MKLFCASLGMLHAMSCLGSDNVSEIKVRVSVPREVSKPRLGLTEAAPSPVLMLEGVETRGQAFRIRVLGPAAPGGTPLFLGSASMVGSRASQIKKMTLAVPLNERAAEALRDQREITLTLQVQSKTPHPPLKYDRISFDTAGGK